MSCRQVIQDKPRRYCGKKGQWRNVGYVLCDAHWERAKAALFRMWGIERGDQ